MRVVLDTNILVLAAITPGGKCDRVVRAATDGVVTPCLSGQVIAEYLDVLQRPEISDTPEDAEQLIEGLRTHGERVAPLPLAVRLPHLADLPFLELAQSAKAVIVTGNKRHFPRSKCGNVAILSPAELLSLLDELDLWPR